MNNKKLVNSTIKGLIERLEKTEQFVLKQTPDICREVLVSIVIRVIPVGIFTSLLSILIPSAVFYIWKLAPIPTFEKSMIALLFGVVEIVPVVATIEVITVLLNIKYAPKLTILKELKSMLKREE